MFFRSFKHFTARTAVKCLKLRSIDHLKVTFLWVQYTQDTQCQIFVGVRTPHPHRNPTTSSSAMNVVYLLSEFTIPRVYLLQFQCTSTHYSGRCKRKCKWSCFFLNSVWWQTDWYNVAALREESGWPCSGLPERRLGLWRQHIATCKSASDPTWLRL